jgi:hypothetical protein
MARIATKQSQSKEREQNSKERSPEPEQPSRLYGPHADILTLQRLAGNRAVSASLQPKLRIGSAGDRYEQEADRLAEQVLAAPAHSVVSGTPTRIQRFTGQPTGQADAVAPASVDRVLSSPGTPMEPTLQQDMEQRFGFDFSPVRIHTDTAAERSAQDINANAYTVGHNIVFGAGQFSPGTHEGRQLIAHELTHVLQQATTLEAETTANAKASDSVKAANAYAYTVDAPIALGESQYKTNSHKGQSLLSQELNHALLQHITIPKVQCTGKPKDEKPLDLDDPAERGRVFEVSEAEEWRSELKKQGYTEVYINKKGEFKDSPLLKKAFTDKRAGPDIAAIDRDNKRILVGDITAGAWSQTDLKPGDKRKLPNELGGEEQKPHLEKTVEDAKQLVRNLPEEYKDYRVVARDRYREDPRARYSVEVMVQAGKRSFSGPSKPGLGSGSSPKREALGAGRTPTDPESGSQPKAATTPSKPTVPPGETTSKAIAQKPPIQGARPPLVGSQGQRVFTGRSSPAIKLPEVEKKAEIRDAKFRAAAMAIGMAMAKLDEIGRSLQNQDARTKIDAARREIIDALQKEPGVGAVIEVQFLEPEHRFQDVYWHLTTEANAGKPTRVANEENRQPQSSFIYVEPMRAAASSTESRVMPPTEVKTGEEFIAAYMKARGADFSGIGTISIEMYDAIQRGNRVFGFTDVRVGSETIRLPDSAYASIEAGITNLAEGTTKKKLDQLKSAIDTQQARLTEKLKDWLGGAIKLTDHELDPARAHYAAASNYLKDKKFGPALESINAGYAQVEEVWAEIYEYDYGHRPVAPPVSL